MASPPLQPLSHPFYTLPTELIFEIIGLLPPDAFINFAFANYPLLLTYGLAPSLTPDRFSYLVRQTRITNHFQLLPFPSEVIMQILSRLRPIDLLNFVMANYQTMAARGIAPALTPETIQQLRRSITPRRE